MKKLYKTLGVVVTATLFAACSDEASSNAPNTAGGAIEDTNPTAEVDSIKAQSSSSAEVLSSSTVDTPTGNLTESDRQYIQETILSYGLPTYIEASDMCPENDNECLASFYDSIAIAPTSPVEYGFPIKTEREKIYEHLNNEGRSCTVFKYPIQNGGQMWGSVILSYSLKTVLLRENDGNRYAHYLLANSYEYDTDQSSCPIDSIAFANECNSVNGVLASYGEGCSTRFTPRLDLACIAKIDESVTLDSLIAPLPGECESYISNDSTDLKPPKMDVAVHCSSDPRTGNEIVCDTLETYNNEE
ncbi:hypothetical protein [Fibrobacter sp.]|uniref:hypothetical protein n=1 Tax=Fibrobacter sp. TaxID=35828 RepID=UPI00388FCD6E